MKLYYSYDGNKSNSFFFFMEPIAQDFKSCQKILAVLGFPVAQTGRNLAKLRK